TRTSCRSVFLHHPGPPTPRDPPSRRALYGGPVDRFSDQKVVGTCAMLNNAVAFVVPDFPAEAGQCFETTQCWYYFPSKMNCRTSLIALSRFGAIASRPDDFSQACALS